ncbi:CopG family transcriptional regulator [Burkholderia pyrrocinia]|nr:CopG family transcriptional regulator [Burkholderia pyrrocinia]EKS9896735.1 CopG family transcriptional regulator [Burkholderia pyrrocinia]EKS9907344.1 CopG family transcriptional regulator [Burkholderia pyrrocinia]
MAKSVRTTVSLPAEQLTELEKIARDSHVSTSWVVREAVRQYLAGRYPLLTEHADSEPKIKSIQENEKRRH